MFRNVLGCSVMFHVPGFIDGLDKMGRVTCYECFIGLSKNWEWGGEMSYNQYILKCYGSCLVVPYVGWQQEPSTRSLQLTHIPVTGTAFSQTDLLSRIQIPIGTSVHYDHKHGLMSTCPCEAALFYAYRSVLMWTGSLGLAYIMVKISKNRLVR